MGVYRDAKGKSSHWPYRWEFENLEGAKKTTKDNNFLFVRIRRVRVKPYLARVEGRTRRVRVKPYLARVEGRSCRLWDNTQGTGETVPGSGGRTILPSLG